MIPPRDVDERTGRGKPGPYGPYRPFGPLPPEGEARTGGQAVRERPLRRDGGGTGDLIRPSVRTGAPSPCAGKALADSTGRRVDSRERRWYFGVPSVIVRP